MKLTEETNNPNKILSVKVIELVSEHFAIMTTMNLRNKK